MCSQSLVHTHRCVNTKRMKVDTIEKLVFHELSKELKVFSPVLNRNIKAPGSIQIKTRIAQIDRDIQQYIAAAKMANGAMVQYLSECVNKLDRERMVVQDRLRQIEKTAEHSTTALSMLQFWDQFTVNDKMLVLDAFVESITITDSQITILWKF